MGINIFRSIWVRIGAILTNLVMIFMSIDHMIETLNESGGNMKLADRSIKTIAIGAAVFFLVCTLAGCLQYTGYKGEYPALYTEAVNSILAIKGFHNHGDALINLVEEDSFGRILFSYYDDSYYYGEYFLSYLICQKIDETYVYYYPDYNFIIKESNWVDVPFSDEEIEDFKNKNDWGKEIKEKELIKYKITRKKKEPEVEIETKDFDVLFQKIAKEHGRNGNGTMVDPYVLYLTSDSYGRTLYFASANHTDVNKEVMEINLAIIFNPDGSYDEKTCVMELMDFYNYHGRLKEFKELNGWDQPPE